MILKVSRIDSSVTYNSLMQLADVQPIRSWYSQTEDWQPLKPYGWWFSQGIKTNKHAVILRWFAKKCPSFPNSWVEIFPKKIPWKKPGLLERNVWKTIILARLANLGQRILPKLQGYPLNNSKTVACLLVQNSIYHISIRVGLFPFQNSLCSSTATGLSRILSDSEQPIAGCLRMNARRIAPCSVWMLFFHTLHNYNTFSQWLVEFSKFSTTGL